MQAVGEMWLLHLDCMTAVQPALVVSKHQHGACAGGARDLAMRQELLNFVLEDSPQPLQPSLCPGTVSAIHALVSMLPQQGGTACPVPECMWSTAAGGETEAQLLCLMPGELWPLPALQAAHHCS